ncbi:hypothetical protein PAXRUDRAFT_824764 [Paxillus rubicundulus Ve08.2h10]|uniref:Unplaced genomic scaffold scaffold_106, whole genome shotgun sequence n=1 Tax=Paxillus rubicundulus Ve08.2h10 TaxID=930991 RepID=A0A0D0EBG9_9AGAM|nr:hypothetical protein PAXRUDRAFT_824764 [Paxillus rubicundulus Ve08.2h10]
MTFLLLLTRPYADLEQQSSSQQSDRQSTCLYYSFVSCIRIPSGDAASALDLARR